MIFQLLSRQPKRHVHVEHRLFCHRDGKRTEQLSIEADIDAERIRRTLRKISTYESRQFIKLNSNKNSAYLIYPTRKYGDNQKISIPTFRTHFRRYSRVSSI
ncbi:hypothetical protein RvY_18544 [Ramazzottius varieornatus]|uniref:Uncharacterized protein n=1 Tax=Ramazzottius varieornatus TaxID=947166 RepID=A0A1D1W661_RAMVA|nr:hypothetical protein RvY_18544 [Ramazzottius varieornatus]